MVIVGLCDMSGGVVCMLLSDVGVMWVRLCVVLLIRLMISVLMMWCIVLCMRWWFLRCGNLVSVVL